MASCNLCDVNIDDNQQSYVIMDLGPELLGLLRERIQHEISDHSVLCSNCFDGLMRSLGRRERRFSAHDINSCLWCHCSLRRRAGQRQRRSIILQPGPEYYYICTTLNSQVPINGRICYLCWFRAHRCLQRNVAINATRNIEFERSPVYVVEHCIFCNGQLFGSQTSMLPEEGPQRNIVSLRIQPREIHENARLCHSCWVRTQRMIDKQQNFEVEPEEETVQPEEIAQPSKSRHNLETIHLNTVKRVGATEGNCFVPGCRNPERLLVPTFLRKRLLSDQKVYVPINSRVCQEHKVVYNREFIQQFPLRNDFCNTDVEDMIEIIIN